MHERKQASSEKLIFNFRIHLTLTKSIIKLNLAVSALLVNWWLVVVALRDATMR